MTYLVKVFHRNFTNSLDIYSVLSKYNIITAFHKFYKLEDFLKYNDQNNPRYSY